MSADEPLLTPEKLKLLKSVVNIQERQLEGCALIFKGFSHLDDAEVSSASKQAYEALTETALVIDAMVDALTATKH